MPCNIGYRNTSRVTIPVPMPQEFKEKTEAPKIDADLLAKIGAADQEFLEWMLELDINPLLKEALKRSLANVGKTDPVKFSIGKSGYLNASASYVTKGQEKMIKDITDKVFNRFQMEVLAITAQLLDYEVSLSQTAIEGEKNTGTGVNRYFKITNSGENSLLQFEHFESKSSLRKETDKFLALAQKLGVKIAVAETEEKGQAIPEGTVHTDFLRQGGD